MLTEAKTIKAATFAGNEQLGQMLELPVIWNKATAKPVKSAGTGDLYMLTNGIRGSQKYTDLEWCSWMKSDTVTFTLDLKKPELVNKLTLGSITNYGMAVHKPAEIEVWFRVMTRSIAKWVSAATQRTKSSVKVYLEKISRLK